MSPLSPVSPLSSFACFDNGVRKTQSMKNLSRVSKGGPKRSCMRRRASQGQLKSVSWHDSVPQHVGPQRRRPQQGTSVWQRDAQPLEQRRPCPQDPEFPRQFSSVCLVPEADDPLDTERTSSRSSPALRKRCLGLLEPTAARCGCGRRVEVSGDRGCRTGAGNSVAQPL